MNSFRLRTLVEIALTIALAAVLNLVKLFELPQGGSVSLVMLPLVVLALVRGVGPGVVAGTLYGFVDLAMNPQVYFPLQVVLDYPVAFGVVGLAGLFSPRWWRLYDEGRPALGVFTAILPGIAVATLARFAVHVLSGILFFGQFAPEGQPVWAYSTLYNSFTIVAGILTAAAAAVIVPALARAQGSLAPDQ